MSSLIELWKREEIKQTTKMFMMMMIYVWKYIARKVYEKMCKELIILNSDISITKGIYLEASQLHFVWININNQQQKL